MLNVAGTIHLSASDLVGHLNCRYLSSLDLAVANGKLAKPLISDPVLEVLAERGALHERSYVDHLKASGLPVTAIDGVGVDSTLSRAAFRPQDGRPSGSDDAWSRLHAPPFRLAANPARKWRETSGSPR